MKSRSKATVDFSVLALNAAGKRKRWSCCHVEDDLYFITDEQHKQMRVKFSELSVPDTTTILKFSSTWSIGGLFKIVESPGEVSTRDNTADWGQRFNTEVMERAAQIRHAASGMQLWWKACPHGNTAIFGPTRVRNGSVHTGQTPSIWRSVKQCNSHTQSEARSEAPGHYSTFSFGDSQRNFGGGLTHTNKQTNKQTKKKNITQNRKRLCTHTIIHHYKVEILFNAVAIPQCPPQSS